jgi:acyl-coenzyme A synthetase/AMP-(fatty) acid ligase
MLWDRVSALAAAAPRPAVSVDGQPLTYGELAARARRGAESWRAAGTLPRLAHVARHPADVAVALVAASLAGVSVLLLDAAATEAEHDHALRLFRADSMTDTDRRSGAAAGEDPAMAVVAAAPGLGLTTSGVEGLPKCVQRPWDTVTGNAAAFAAAIGLAEGDVLLCTTPPHHSYAVCGGLVAALTTGATYVSLAKRASPGSVAEAIDREHVDLMLSVPVLYRWYATGLRAARPPRMCVSAGSPLGAEDRATWHRTVGWPLVEHYGTSELGMLTVDTAGVAGSVGHPVAGIEIRLDAPDGEGVSEVQARAAGTPGWLLHPTGSVTDLGGWQRTGDLGRCDDDGGLRLVGRRGSVVNLGGNKVSAAEVEAAIRAHHAVVDCAVVGECVDGVTRLCAYLEVRAPDFHRQGLVEHLRSRLAPHKIPSVVTVVDALPRSAAGKILRSRLHAP